MCITTKQEHNTTYHHYYSFSANKHRCYNEHRHEKKIECCQHTIYDLVRSNSERRAAQRSQVVVCRPRQRKNTKNTKNIFILHTRTLIIQKRAQSLIYSCPLSILFVVVSTRICPVDVSGRVCTYVSVQCPVCPLWTGSLSMALITNVTARKMGG